MMAWKVYKHENNCEQRLQEWMDIYFFKQYITANLINQSSLDNFENEWIDYTEGVI